MRRISALQRHLVAGDDISVVKALATRKSCRNFDTARAVPQEVVARILERANRTPSDVNITPWKVFVVGGATRDALVAEAIGLRKQGPPPGSLKPLPLPEDKESK